MPKKILLIHYFYKPFSSNQSFRYEQILNSQTCQDIQIDILTSSHHSIPNQEILDNITIYRVNSIFLKKRLRQEGQKKKNIQEIQKKKVFIKRVKNFLFKFIWPDFALLWIFPAIKKGIRLAKKEKYDLIISGSFPFSSHIVGFFIKRKYPTIRWVVDYIDPFALLKNNENPSNNTLIYGRLNVLAERKINEVADKVIILNEAYSRYKILFPDLTSKVSIAPPMLGIDRHQYEMVEPYTFDNSFVNIVFIGSLYKSIRNPEPIIEIISKLPNSSEKICMHFIGDYKDCEDILQKYHKSSAINIKLYGKVSREMAMSYMKGADILLNISNASAVQLPGKVVEYVYSGKKIINFSNNEDNSSNDFFREKLSSRLYFEISNQKVFSYTENLLEFINDSKENASIEVNMEDHLPENISKVYL